MRVEADRLIKFILDAGLISEEQAKKTLEKSRKSDKEIGSILVAEGLINEKEMTKIEAYLLGIPFINLEKETIAPEVLRMIPESIAKAHGIVAFRKKGDNLEVAMTDPENLKIIETIRKILPSVKILPRLTTSESIKSALTQYQTTLEREFKDILTDEGQEIKHIKETERVQGGEDIKRASEELPIIKIVDTLLKHAILQEASDIHIEPLEKEVIVRYRIDGILRDVMTLPNSTALGIVARIKVLSNLKLDEHRLPQDGRFKIETEDFKYSLRVSVLPVFNGEKIVMRLLAENTESIAPDALGFQGKALEKVKESLKKASGMILITGPTGSGKTTTLYSMMDVLNTTEVNISTVEDPIEYRMPRINQTQVNPQIGLTFSAGLRVLVRQDPDIIMVGEIRDNETAGLAINAALTGHLVLSTLHTTQAAGAIPRLIDMEVEPFLIASTVDLIIAQRLVRKFAGDKEKYKLSATELKELGKYCNLNKILEILMEEKLIKPEAQASDIEFYRPQKSAAQNKAYKGRLAIVEVLPMSEAIRNLVATKASTKDISQKAVEEGMRTMIEDGIVKAAQGLTSLEEVLRVITE